MILSDLPKVSIVIPVYNGDNYLAEAIKSALAQTYANLEIIVVNDGSTDDGATAAIAHQFKDKIRYYEQPNGGVATALNTAIGHMTGELFSWLSHDDVYTPDKIEREVEAWVRTGKQTIIYSNYHIIDESSRTLYQQSIETISEKGMALYLMVSNALHGCTLLIPRSYLVEAGLFDPSQRITQDYDMWFKLAQCHSYHHVPHDLVGIRFHPNQLTMHYQDDVTTENDALYQHFIITLPLSDIRAYWPDRPSTFYKQIYIRMSARHLFKAMKIAREKYLLCAGEECSHLPAPFLLWLSTFQGILMLRLRVLARRVLFQKSTRKIGMPLVKLWQSYKKSA